MSVPFRAERRPVEATPQALIRPVRAAGGRGIPALIEPAVPGVDINEWASAHVDYIDGLLLEHKALLFRGFHRQHAGQFDAFGRITARSEPLEYRDRSSPRTNVGDRVYTSTVYPASRRIKMHNEATYWLHWPLKIYFACVKPSATGGETPLANVAAVLRRLRPETRERFEASGYMLVRNYNEGFGLPWQEVFQTEDRQEVERYCRLHQIEFAWRDGDRLRTWQVRPAIRRHPRSGELVWFNHAAFFHPTAYDPGLRQAMTAELSEDRLPFSTFYGDGSEIDEAVVREIHDAYESEKVSFRWEAGDILMLDNMTIAHGREPYEGERLVHVAMYELHGDPSA